MDVPAADNLRGWSGVFFVALLVLGQATQNLSVPLWINRLPEDSCVDAFVLFLIMILWYPVMFFITSVIVNLWKREAPLQFIIKYTRQDHWAIFKTGFFDALNGALVIPASPTDRTPAVVAALIGSTTLLPLILIKHYYLGLPASSTRHYKSREFMLVLVLYFASAYTLVYPTLHHNDTIGPNVYWWLVFFVGSCCGQFYNVQQEKSFKFWSHSSFQEYVGYLFWQTFYLCLWGYALIWMDLIPNFGQAAEQGLPCGLADTFKYSFQQPALAYNILFNVGYYITYIAACFVNTSDALLGTVASVLVTALVTAISYPIAELTPDQSVVEIGLVPLTIFLSAASMYTYSLWSKETGIYKAPSLFNGRNVNADSSSSYSSLDVHPLSESLVG